MMDQNHRIALQIYRNPEYFVLKASQRRLRSYQGEVLNAIIQSIRAKAGRSFVVIFSRQSGKNELQAQLFVYLLAVLSRCALNIVSVSPTYKPQTLTAMSRLEKVLSRNLFNHRVDLVPMDGLNLLSASMCFRISRKSMRPEKLYLTDIVEACKAIEVFCEGVTFN